MSTLDLHGFRFLFRAGFWSHLWREINKDNCWGMAAELAYYFLLGFFPFLLFISDVITYSPIEPALLGKILNELNRFLPEMTQEEVIQIIERTQEASGSYPWVFLWMVVALWWASLGVNGMVAVLNRAYRVREDRPYVSVLLLCMVVTVGVSIFIITSGILVFFGDDLIRFILSRLFLDEQGFLRHIIGLSYSILRWFLILLLLNIGIQIVYHALPARRHPWSFVSPGSLFASLGWLLGSLVFSVFVNQSPAYGRIYGSLKGLIVLMIWFYLSSLFLVVGGGMDSEIYRVRRSGDVRAIARAPRTPERG